MNVIYFVGVSASLKMFFPRDINIDINNNNNNTNDNINNNNINEKISPFCWSRGLESYI